jgi:hypothetical protein
VVDENTKYFNIWQLIRSTVSGIDISGDINSPIVRFKRYNSLGNVFSSQAADPGSEESANITTTNGIAYYLNEVNVSKEVVDNISMHDISLVKVYKGTSAFILGAGEGAIAVYTTNGNNSFDPRVRGFEMIK